MTEPTPQDASPEARAHELYWHSDQGVNAIAESLGLSKSRLYEAVRPLPAGALCPECGRELVYETRTARDRSEAVCPDGCGRVRGEEAPGSGPEAPDTRRLAAGLLLGAAAGLLLYRLSRR